MTALSVLTQRFLANDLPEETLNQLRASRLVGLEKKSGGVRPVAIGEAITKVATGIAVERNLEALRTAVEPIQLGLAPGGCENIVHEAREELEKLKGDAVMITIDASNAFNEVSRQAIAAALRRDKTLAPLRSTFRALYGSESVLVMEDEDGVFTFRASGGVRQGCPLSPAFFALATIDMLKKVQREHPRVWIRAYLDDVTIIGKDKDVEAAARALMAEMAKISLRVNASKSLVAARNPQVATAVATNLGFTRCDHGMRILGAWVSVCAPGSVGERTSTLKYLQEVLDEYPGILNSCMNIILAYGSGRRSVSGVET